MKSPKEKYLNDAAYKSLVDFMVNQIIECNYTPSEMREAAILASIIYEEQNLRSLNLEAHDTSSIVASLKAIRKWLEE